MRSVMPALFLGAIENMNGELAVGIDLGGTNVRAALVSPRGEIVRTSECRTRPERGSDVVIDEMATMVNTLIKEQGSSRDSIVGLGVGSPGPLSHRDGVIYKAANLPGWENVRLRRLLLERTGLPTLVDNDANAAAYGEYWVGAGKSTRHIVVFTLGTGLGSGVVINGEILRGHFENAGEMGHMIVVAGGRPCSCGQNGCFEQYASAGNLAKHCMARIRQGQQSTLREVLERDGEFGAKAVAEAAQAGDDFAAQAWDEACYYIAVGCVNAQHAFNPQVIVLAGGMTKAGSFLLSAVTKHFRKLCWRLLDDAPDIAISVLGDDAGVVGAAGLAWAAHDDSV